MSGILSQIGFADETTYGTHVTPTRFLEMNKESVEGMYERIESESLRAGTRVQRSDRFAVNPKGASGTVEFEVMSKGFAYFLKHMLGTVATTGAAAPYVHTGTIGSLTGDYFTCQIGRPRVDGVLDAYNYNGGKVTEWEITNSVDGILMLSLGMDFSKEVVGTPALASASYPVGSELLTFVGGTVTIGGTAVNVKDISIKCNNNLKDDRYFLRGDASKKEPLEAEHREVEFELTFDYESLDVYNRIKATTVAGTLGVLVAKWISPDGSFLEVTLPAARFDSGTPQVEGMDLLEQSVSGKGLFNGTDSAVTIKYSTSDALP